MSTYTAAYVVKAPWGNNKFRGFVDYYDEDGKRKKKSRVLKATNKRAAEREAEDWRNQLERESLVDILADWLKVQQEEFNEFRRTVGAGDYVLGDLDGYLSPDTLSKGWSAIAKAVGVKGTEGRIPTFHDLRHTWATRYLAEGGDVKTASSVLGHANAAITLNTYASADPDAKRRSARLTEAVANGRTASQSGILELTGTDN